MPESSCSAVGTDICAVTGIEPQCGGIAKDFFLEFKFISSFQISYFNFSLEIAQHPPSMTANVPLFLQKVSSRLAETEA